MASTAFQMLVRLLLGACLFVPLLAGHQAMLVPRRARVRLVHWIGLTIAGELGLAFPLAAFAVAIRGSDVWAWYRVAYLFGLAAPVLAVAMVQAHLRRLESRWEGSRTSALASVGFALLLAVALIPCVLGAPLPFRGHAPVSASVTQVGHYVVVVAPVSGVLLLQAVLLLASSPWAILQPGNRSVLLLATLLVLVVAGAALALPGSLADARAQSQRERARQREEAEQMDQPRRRALADIIAGRPPRRLPEPCPADDVPASWQAMARQAVAPRHRSELRVRAEAWRSLVDVNLWTRGPGVGISPDKQGERTNSETALGIPASPLDGPRARAILAALAEEAWLGPWSEGDVVIGPEEARRRVRARATRVAADIDATLVVARELPALSIGASAELGELDGALWIWRYSKRAFVCVGDVHVHRVGMQATLTDEDADVARDALRLRAVAQAVQALQAVAPPR
jgi:hypothetical protein